METRTDGNPSPKLWIGLTAILAVAVVALAIWGLGQKSDLDDANDKLDKIEQQAGTVEKQQAANERSLKGFGAAEEAKFRKARQGYEAADKSAAEYKNQVTQEANALQQARTELANAKSAEDKAAAQKKVSSAATRAAVTCAQAAVDAIGEFSSEGAGANNPSGAAEKAMNQLSEVSGPCNQAISAG